MKLYLEPHQTRDKEPNQYENVLGNSIELAFSQGIAEVGDLVEFLNQNGPLPQAGDRWTETSFGVEMKRLGN